MKILVTGGAGFIGSHLVDALSRESNEVVIFDNFHRGSMQNIRRHLKKKNVKLIKGDIRNSADLNKIGSVDMVYHFAAQSNVIGSFLNPDYAVSTNVHGTYNILEYSSKNKVKRLIFSSSREVYGNPLYLPVDENHPLNPINMYGATKACGEMLCSPYLKMKKIDITILRIANVYGDGDRERVIPIFLEKAKKNINLEVFGGRQTLDFIWVGDVVRAIMDISKSGRYADETINIGTGTGTSIENLAKMIIKATNSKSRIINKKVRLMDVKSFVSKSDKFKMKTLSLSDGLKKMLG